LSQEELEAVEAAFRKRRELEEQERADFLDWIGEIAEAEEKAELRQRIRDLELENESLQGFEQEHVEHVETREDFEKDLMLTNEAEVLGDILTEEEIDRRRNDVVTEPTEITELPPEAIDAPENTDEVEDEETESEVE